MGKDKKTGLCYFTKPEVYWVSRNIIINDFDSYVAKYIKKGFLDTDGLTLSYGSCQLIMEFAARTCYDSEKKLGKNPDFVRKLLKKEHDTVAEFAWFAFRVRGCSRIFTHEIITHRHLSKLQFSTRYCEHFNFVIPPECAGEPESIRLLLDNAKNCLNNYDKLRQLFKDEKSQKENARYCLPLCTEAPITIAGNLRCWRDIFKRRKNKFVAPEMLVIIEMIYEKIKKHNPVFVEGFEDEIL